MRLNKVIFLLVFFQIFVNGENTKFDLSSNDNSVRKICAGIDTKNKTEQFRHYDFDIKIDVRHLQNHNEYNYKYLINLSWEHNEKKDDFIFYKSNLLQKVIYKYIENKDTRSYHYDRIPQDTLQFILSNQQLDSIYLLTSRLFQIDSLNLAGESINHSVYDGYYTEIELANQHDATYKIMLTDLSSERTLENYKNLLSYIESVQKERVFLPGVESKTLLK